MVSVANEGGRLTIILGEKWQEFIARKITSGEFRDAGEVLRAGLSLLAAKDRENRISVSSLGELEEKLLQGAKSFDAGEAGGKEGCQRLRLAGLVREHISENQRD